MTMTGKEYLAKHDKKVKAKLRAKRKKAKKKAISKIDTYEQSQINSSARKMRRFSHPNLKKSSYGLFYKSDDWMKIRYLALKNTDGRCCCCGVSAKDGAILHVDHIKPRSRYPELELDLDNIQILCSFCNKGKGAWDCTDWR